jgi:hypothetical protein
MNKRTITVICPKEQEKSYFSFKKHHYSNHLNIYLNNNLLFEGINDAEENLPITLKKNIDIDYNTVNILKFNYNINFKNSSKELVDVEYKFEPIDNQYHYIKTEINRHNYVLGSEQLDDDYKVTININEHTHIFGKNYHQGETKNINFFDKINLQQQGLTISLDSKKTFQNNTETTFDQIRLELR